MLPSSTFYWKNEVLECDIQGLSEMDLGELSDFCDIIFLTI